MFHIIFFYSCLENKQKQPNMNLLYNTVKEIRDNALIKNEKSIIASDK